MSRVHVAQKMSSKKKIAAVAAIVLAVAMLLGGALAFNDFSQSVANRFHGSANPDGILHDDFEKDVNKDVYVENTGDTPLVVRVQFAEYLQVGNSPIVGSDANDKSTWVVRTFDTAPDAAGALPSQNHHIWYMTGNSKIYKPGTGELGNYNYYNGQSFEDGTVATETLSSSKVILMSTYMSNQSYYDSVYPNGMWLLDSDGWCYWSKLLNSGDATNLLLDNVTIDPDDRPDDNYYYAIDVRMQVTNLTEAHMLLEDASYDATNLIEANVQAAAQN